MCLRGVAAAILSALIVTDILTAADRGDIASSIPAGAAGTVYVFITTDCPIANRYAPEIKRLAERFTSRGIRFLLVYPAPGDSELVVLEHMKRFDYQLSHVLDPRLQLVKRTGVTVAPEVAVENPQGEIVYRGRIDDRYVDFGKERIEPTTHDLARALDALVAGKPILVHETRAVGCFLADLLK